MGELGELRNKVNQAVERLSSAHDTRRRQSQGLMTLLTDLESKYEARNEELEHSKQRIEALAFQFRQVNFRADEARRVAAFQFGETSLRQGHREAALGAIMRALYNTGLDEAEQSGAERAFSFQIAARRRAGFLLMQHLQKRRAAEAVQGIFGIDRFAQ